MGSCARWTVWSTRRSSDSPHEAKDPSRMACHGSSVQRAGTTDCSGFLRARQRRHPTSATRALPNAAVRTTDLHKSPVRVHRCVGNAVSPEKITRTASSAPKAAARAAVARLAHPATLHRVRAEAAPTQGSRSFGLGKVGAAAKDATGPTAKERTQARAVTRATSQIG